MVQPSSPPNPGRRKFLSYATSFLGLIGTAFVAVPFLSAFKPSARAEAAGAPVQVDISTINTGEMMIVEWRGKPVFVVKISDDSIKLLSQVDAKLADPSLETPFQPEYAKNEFRSRKEGIAVITGVCSHLGCSPKYYPEPGSTDFDPDWQGGFFCPCHGSKFDLLGRVYAGVPAPTNLEIPPYQYLTDSLIRIGIDQKNT